MSTLIPKLTKKELTTEIECMEMNLDAVKKLYWKSSTDEDKKYFEKRYAELQEKLDRLKEAPTNES